MSVIFILRFLQFSGPNFQNRKNQIFKIQILDRPEIWGVAIFLPCGKDQDTPPKKEARGGVEFSLFSFLFFYENHQLFVVDMNPKQYFSTFFSKICRTPLNSTPPHDTIVTLIWTDLKMVKKRVFHKKD